MNDYIAKELDMREPEKNLEKREILGGKIADKSKTESTLRNTTVAQLRNSDELKSFKNVNSQVSTIYERLADADEKIRLLERNVYGFKAAALGITNPDIRTIPLKRANTFLLTPSVQRGQPLLDILSLELMKIPLGSGCMCAMPTTTYSKVTFIPCL